MIWIATDIVYFSFMQIMFTEHSPYHDLSTFIQTLGLEIVFGGQFCGPLWYITAYTWTLIIIYIFNIRRGTKTFLLITILLLYNIFIGTYNFMLPFEIKYLYFNNNFLTSAFPFVLLGAFLKNNTKKIKTQHGHGLSYLSFVIWN